VLQLIALVMLQKAPPAAIEKTSD